MLSDLLILIKEYYSKDQRESKENQDRLTLRSQVKQLADRTFSKNPTVKKISIEVSDEYLPYIDAIFEDELLNQNYWVEQDSFDEKILHLYLQEIEL